MNALVLPDITATASLSTWLAKATYGLAEQSRVRVVEEITTHFEQQVEAEIAAGAPADEAHRVALVALGSARAARVRFNSCYLLTVEERMLDGLSGKPCQPAPYLTVPTWTIWLNILACMMYHLFFFYAIYAHYTWGRLVFRCFGAQRMREVCWAIAAIQVFVASAILVIAASYYEQLITVNFEKNLFAFVMNIFGQVLCIYVWCRLAMKLPKSPTGVKS